MASLSLSGINTYPVKSTAGQALNQAVVEKRGLKGDRRWMVTAPDGRFLTGRQLPRLTLIKARDLAGGLQLSAPGVSSIALGMPTDTAHESQVLIWKDQLAATDAGDEVACWLSGFLGQECRLVHMGEHHLRPVDPDYSQAGDVVSFADGFPLLLISEASLDDLNNRLEQAVSMAHFRPNLVVRGCPAYEEDQWRRMTLGTVEFEIVKPCARCVFTTVDPETGEMQADGQPLRTLTKYRRDSRGRVMFGVNLIARGEGELKLGGGCRVRLHYCWRRICRLCAGQSTQRGPRKLGPVARGRWQGLASFYPHACRTWQAGGPQEHQLGL
jgi:uncharacterized protein YcbX